MGNVSIYLHSAELKLNTWSALLQYLLCEFWWVCRTGFSYQTQHFPAFWLFLRHCPKEMQQQFHSLGSAPALPWGEVLVSPPCPQQGWVHLGTNPALLWHQAAPSPALCPIPSPENPIYHLSDWNRVSRREPARAVPCGWSQLLGAVLWPTNKNPSLIPRVSLENLLFLFCKHQPRGQQLDFTAV